MSDDLSLTRSADALRSGKTSYGVVRLVDTGEEREYETGDEALVEAGQAVWVVAPVHLPAAGRRLDHDAEREANPLSGVEAYPPAVPTAAARTAEANRTGSVKAHSDAGLGDRLAAKRTELAHDQAGEGDAAEQAALGGAGARSVPVVSPEPESRPASRAAKDK